jgi:hypothetical protein
MRKVDGLSLIFIDFYVPVLRSHVNRTEISLQFSENTTPFAVCCSQSHIATDGQSISKSWCRDTSGIMTRYL